MGQRGCHLLSIKPHSCLNSWLKKHLQMVKTGKVLEIGHQKIPQAFSLWCGLFALQVSSIFADVSSPSRFKIIIVKRKTAPFCQAVLFCQLLRSFWVNKRPRITSPYHPEREKQHNNFKTTRSAHCQHKPFRQVAFCHTLMRILPLPQNESYH